MEFIWNFIIQNPSQVIFIKKPKQTEVTFLFSKCQEIFLIGNWNIVFISDYRNIFLAIFTTVSLFQVELQHLNLAILKAHE